MQPNPFPAPLQPSANNGSFQRMQHPSPNTSLNVHASTFQVGSSQMMNANVALLNASRPLARRYESEPLHSSSARERYQNPTSTIHSASYLTTSTSSQVTSRTTSRTSSIAPSPRSVSPHGAGQHFIGGGYYQQPQGQQISPPTGTSSSRTLLPPQSQIGTPAPPPHTNRPTASSGSTSPSADSRQVCCSTCMDTRQENVHLRAQLAAFNYQLEGVKNSTKAEIAKMRQDVTKALIAFESRLHLQLQQQIGFKPDLDPMVTGHAPALPSQPTTNVVSQALNQIQKQLDQFESRTLPPPDHHRERSGQTVSPGSSSPFLGGPSSKRASWSLANSPLDAGALLSATASPANASHTSWPGSSPSTISTPSSTSSYTPSVQSQMSSATRDQSQPLTPSASASTILANLNLSNLNLGNVNLQQLSQLLNAVNNLQQIAGQGQPGNALLQPQSPHSHQHHQQPGMTEERLIMLAIDILSVHGAVPVGKMGSLLHKAANDHTLPQMLKERYGGLKKFLNSVTFTSYQDVPSTTLCLTVSEGSTIESVMRDVAAKSGIPTGEQRLVWGGKQLDQSRTIGFYGIQPNVTVNLLLRLPGGVTATSAALPPPPPSTPSIPPPGSFQIFITLPARRVATQTQFFSLGSDHPYNPSLSLSPEFLAANPHIRPPEPQLSPPPMEAALPPALGSSDPSMSYSQYTSSQYTPSNSTSATSSSHPPLLTPLSAHSNSSPNLQLQYDYTRNHDAFDGESIDEFGAADYHHFASEDRMENLFRPSRSESSLSMSGHASSTAASSGTTSRASLVAPDAIHAAHSNWDRISNSTTASAEPKLVSPKDPAIPDASVSPTPATMPLAQAETSPTLGATQASAEANRTFFSRLLS